MDKSINDLNLFHDEINSISAEHKDMLEKQLENDEEQIQEHEGDEREDEKEEEVINNNNNENINNNNMEEDRPDAKCHDDRNDTALPHHNNLTNNFASIETMLHNDNNHIQSNKDNNNYITNTNQLFNHDNHNGMQGKRNDPCDQLSSKHYSDNRSNQNDSSVKWWHPHVYANPPKMPTPFLITNILGISNNNNSSNCYEFPNSPSDNRLNSTDVKLDEPLNLCVKNKSSKNSNNSSSFDIHGHVGRKASLNSTFNSSLKIKGKILFSLPVLLYVLGLLLIEILHYLYVSYRYLPNHYQVCKDDL